MSRNTTKERLEELRERAANGEKLSTLHKEAAEVLLKFIQELGYSDVCDAYDKIEADYTRPTKSSQD